MAATEHSLSVHTGRLNSLCRICGGRSKRKKQKGTVRKCASLQVNLTSMFNINTAEESNTKYSTTLCMRCYNKIYKLQKMHEPSEVAKAIVINFIEKSSSIWTEFDESVTIEQCKSCLKFDQQIPNNRTGMGGTPQEEPAVIVQQTEGSPDGGGGQVSPATEEELETSEKMTTEEPPSSSSVALFDRISTRDLLADGQSVAVSKYGSSDDFPDDDNIFNDPVFQPPAAPLSVSAEATGSSISIDVLEKRTGLVAEHALVNEQVEVNGADAGEQCGGNEGALNAQCSSLSVSASYQLSEDALVNEQVEVNGADAGEQCGGNEGALNAQCSSLSVSASYQLCGDALVNEQVEVNGADAGERCGGNEGALNAQCSSLLVSESHHLSEEIMNVSVLCEHGQFNACQSLTQPDESGSVRPLHESTPQKVHGSFGKSFASQKMRPLDEIQLPLTKEEERYYAHITRLVMNESSDKQSIRVKTGGQPLMLRKVSKPRKSFTSLSVRQQTRRSKEVETYRLNSCNQSVDESIEHFSSELKRLSSTHKKKVLEKAGVKQPELNAAESLAMKTTFALSCRKYNQIRTVCKASGMEMPSENSLREFQKGVQCGEVEVKQIEVQTKSDSTPDVQANAAYVTDLEAFITNVLEQYQETNTLTWHSGSIPEDEIWIKIGGDHGGGSFKLMMQVANLQNANSKDNTWLLCLASVKDTYTNLQSLLSHYKTQLGKVNGMLWRGKSIQIFMFGDYEFLTKVYGLSGAQGKHPCLWCKATKEDVQKAASVYPLVPQRTLGGLKRDHKRFKNNPVKSKAIKAKAYYNVIHRPIFSLELDFVVPPYLHLLLGIVKKHHALLEKECHKLDLLIGKDLAKRVSDFPIPDKHKATPFEKYIQQMAEVHSLEARCIVENNTAFNSANLLKTETDRHRRKSLRRTLEAALEKGADLETRRENLEMEAEKRLNIFEGPVSKNLDAVLARNKIVPQAYHSRSFVGNHCHKYVQPDVSAEICLSVVHKTCEISDNFVLVDKAEDIARKYKSLNDSYFHVHRQISHSKPIAHEDIDSITVSIYQYMHFFRNSFPMTRIIPKQHILERHCVPFMTKFRVGLGLLGEQGGEACHATLNNLKVRVRGMKREKDQLAHLMKDMHTITSPVIQAALPRKM